MVQVLLRRIHYILLYASGIMRTLFTILILISLVACSSFEKPNKITDPEISTRKISEFDIRSGVPAWVAKNKELIEANLIICDDCIGHEVKVHIKLDDLGIVKFLKVVRSSGKKELADAALIAIRKTQPFDISYLNAQDRAAMKNIIFTFVPNKKDIKSLN